MFRFITRRLVCSSYTAPSTPIIERIDSSVYPMIIRDSWKKCHDGLYRLELITEFEKELVLNKGMFETIKARHTGSYPHLFTHTIASENLLLEGYLMQKEPGWLK